MRDNAHLGQFFDCVTTVDLKGLNALLNMQRRLEGNCMAKLEGVLQYADARFSRISRCTCVKKRPKYWQHS